MMMMVMVMVMVMMMVRVRVMVMVMVMKVIMIHQEEMLQEAQSCPPHHNQVQARPVLFNSNFFPVEECGLNMNTEIQ